MQEKNPNQLHSSTQSDEVQDEAQIEQLIRLGGTRDEIDPVCRERVRQNLLKLWEEHHANIDKDKNRLSKATLPRKMFWRQPWALAASVVCVCVALFLANTYNHQEVVARITQVQGKTDSHNALLKAGNEIYAGQEVNTANSLLEISWQKSGVLKINQGTHIIFIDNREILLIKGAIYFDSNHQSNIRIRTTHGLINDIGTQFETRTGSQDLSVYVREGKVKFENEDNNSLFIPSGKALHLHQGNTKISDIDKEKEPWIWADAMDGSMNFDNHTMAEVLAWLAKREGWELEFKTSIDQQHAERNRLHGQFKTTDSRKLLEQLALISDMRYQIINNILLVSYL